MSDRRRTLRRRARVWDTTQPVPHVVRRRSSRSCSAALAIYVVFRMLRYVFVTGRWEIVRVNLKLLLVGRFPDDELWKVVRRARDPRAVGRAARRARPRPPAPRRHATSSASVSPLRSVARAASAGSGRCSSRSRCCSRCRRRVGPWITVAGDRSSAAIVGRAARRRRSARRAALADRPSRRCSCSSLAATPIVLDDDAHERRSAGTSGAAS